MTRLNELSLYRAFVSPKYISGNVFRALWFADSEAATRPVQNGSQALNKFLNEQLTNFKNTGLYKLES